MMGAYDLGGAGKVADVADDPVADFGVSSHDDLLLCGQGSRFKENGVGHTDLPDVMEKRPAVEVHNVPTADVAGVRDDERILSHPEGMVADLVLPRVDGVHEGLERHKVGR